MPSDSLLKNVEDWVVDATSVLRDIYPVMFNWLTEPDGTDKKLGYLQSEFEFLVGARDPAYITEDKIPHPKDTFLLYLQKSNLEIDVRVASVEETEIAIGEWNLKDNASMIFPHGQVDKDAIKRVRAVVRNDDDDELCDFCGDKAGYICWDDTDIRLERSGKGFFDKNEFDGTGFDRGTVYIILA